MPCSVPCSVPCGAGLRSQEIYKLLDIAVLGSRQHVCELLATCASSGEGVDSAVAWILEHAQVLTQATSPSGHACAVCAGSDAPDPMPPSRSPDASCRIPNSTRSDCRAFGDHKVQEGRPQGAGRSPAAALPMVLVEKQDARLNIQASQFCRNMKSATPNIQPS